MPLVDIGDKFRDFSRQTLYLEALWYISKITKKYVNMQTIQSFHFPRPFHIRHSLRDSIRIYKMFKRFLPLDNMDLPQKFVNFIGIDTPNTHVYLHWKPSDVNENSTM